MVGLPSKCSCSQSCVCQHACTQAHTNLLIENFGSSLADISPICIPYFNHHIFLIQNSKHKNQAYQPSLFTLGRFHRIKNFGSTRSPALDGSLVGKEGHGIERPAILWRSWDAPKDHSRLCRFDTASRRGGRAFDSPPERSCTDFYRRRWHGSRRFQLRAR